METEVVAFVRTAMQFSNHPMVPTNFGWRLTVRAARRYHPPRDFPMQNER